MSAHWFVIAKCFVSFTHTWGSQVMDSVKSSAHDFNFLHFTVSFFTLDRTAKLH